jgi:Tfp pilus assembly protein PilV
MGTNRLNQVSQSGKGFTLVEVMVSLVFLMVTLMALLQGLELALQSYGKARIRWKASIGLWNQVEQSRTSPPSGESIQIFPGARPLYRTIVSDPRLEGHSDWEVLRAQK